MHKPLQNRRKILKTEGEGETSPKYCYSRDAREEKQISIALAKEVIEFFAQHFTMLDVTVYGAHCVGKPQEGADSKRAIVCTWVDARKQSIIFDSSEVYLEGNPFYVNEDHIPKQQEQSSRRG